MARLQDEFRGLRVAAVTGSLHVWTLAQVVFQIFTREESLFGTPSRAVTRLAPLCMLGPFFESEVLITPETLELNSIQRGLLEFTQILQSKSLLGALGTVGL